MYQRRRYQNVTSCYNPRMPTLNLRLLGTFDARADGETLPFRSDKIRALLAYLAVEANRPHLRTTLATLFWGERIDQEALANLRVSLTRLRETLAGLNADPPLLSITPKTVQLNLTPINVVHIDVLAFDELLAACETHAHPDLIQCPACMQRLTGAVELYAGDFMAGFTLSDSPAFDEWRLWQETTRHHKVLAALTTLIAYHAARYDEARVQHYARRQIALEPWREEGHRHLMTALARNGQISAALKQYEECCRVLQEELGVEPTADLQTLAEQIRAGNFAPDIAPPATLTRGNLPRQWTPFFGRTEELSQLQQRLNDPAYALITIIGPGGSGKTRLAVACAERVLAQWPQGAWFVSLADIPAEAGPALNIRVITALAEAFQLRLDGSPSPERQLFNHLRHKELLLILDNFEHVLDAAGVVLELLQAAPHLKILVTSRERLNVQAEVVLRLDGLPVPTQITDPQAAGYSSVQLFTERAQRSGGSFTPDERQLQGAAKICQIVAGLPLAIELAAALTTARTCADVAAQIERDLDSLNTSLRDVPARQRSLRAVVAYSWQLLSADEQAVLNRLAVFRGGFDPEAAVSIAAATPGQLAAFIDKSLLRLRPAGRYDWHPFIQQYAREQLTLTSEEAAATQARHAAYFAAWLEQRASDLKGERQPLALAEIDQELENARAAWRWAVEQRAIDLLARGVEGLSLYYDIRGWYQAGAAEFGEAADKLSAIESGGDQRHALTLARVLTRQAFCCFWQSDFDQAEQLLQRSLSLLRPLQARTALAEALYFLGMSQQRRGAYTEAARYAQESLALYRETGNRWGEGAIRHLLGTLERVQGRYEDSRDHHQAAVTIFRELREPRATANALNDLGYLYRLLDRPREAIPLLQEAASIAREVGYKAVAGFAVGNLGSVAYALEQYEEARQCLEEALGIFRDLGSLREVDVALIHLGNVACALGDYAAAREKFLEALRLSAPRSDEPIMLRALVGLARLFAETSQTDRAAQLLAQIVPQPVLEKEYRDRAEQLMAQLQIDPAAFNAAPRDLGRIAQEWLETD
ncbi:Putative HTH-type transcriptional regulator [Thermoflexales bacterium]|nr:Putative HTH-type transcriptional regulator [Thermoflexales bacterium]